MSVPWNYVYIYRSYVSEAVEHPVFQFFIALGILANVILMATEHDGMSDLHRLVLYKANAVSLYRKQTKNKLCMVYSSNMDCANPYR